MHFYIVGKSMDYDPESIIVRLGKFILDNTEYFGPFCSILIKAKGRRRQAMVDAILKTEQTKGRLSAKTIGEFRTLLAEYFEKIDKDGDNASGKIVEFLIAYIGPISFQSESKNIVRDCWVEDENCNRVGGNKNLDIGFYCDYTCLEELRAELIESKLDLNNFIAEKPFEPNNLTMSSRAREKLDYLKTVQEILSRSDHFVMAVATIRYDVELSKRIMTKYGYDQAIEIYDYNHLKDALARLAS